MFGNAINKHQINIFSGCSDLHFYMGEIGFMFFPFVKHTGFDFAFSATAKFCSYCPFVMVQQLTLFGQTNDIILAKFIQFQKHLIVIISSVHGKSCFTKKSSALSYGMECNCIRRFIVFFL